MSEELKLPASGTEGTWDLPFIWKKQTIALTVNEEIIAQEIRDQVSVKKPARKAILRATEKKLSKTLKADFASLNATLQDDTRWNLFILAVDKVMANRHVSVRDNPELASEIAASPEFKAA